MASKKISSGIVGLDVVMTGGYLANMPTLIKGGPGSGKTIITLFFVGHQLKTKGSAVFVTCDESPEQILFHMDLFGLSGTALQQSGKLSILDFPPQVFDQIAGEYELNTLIFRITAARKKIMLKL